MSFTDVIADLATGTYTVTRRLTSGATVVDGIYVPNPSTVTFDIVAAVQPARGLPRITGGRDMLSDEQNQHVVEGLVMWTTTEVRERTPQNDPDEIRVNGRDYTIVRTEYWSAFDEEYWQAVLVVKTQGAS